MNFKGVHYQTEWVELPNVPDVRKRLGPAPNRVHRDGSSFHTLPIIKDLSTGEIIGDSFEIALYLDKAYPDAPTLLPPSTRGLHAAFNTQVDAVFTQHVILCVQGMPFNPETAEISKKTFCWRAGRERWEDLTVEGEDRVKTLASFKDALGNLAKAYKHGNGPFLEGGKVLYADLIVGAWLQFMKATLRKKEWEDLRTWQDGLWGRIHEALERYAEVK